MGFAVNGNIDLMLSTELSTTVSQTTLMQLTSSMELKYWINSTENRAIMEYV